MTTETLTNRKIEAARNVLRQVARGLPWSRSASSPFGMAFPFGRHRPSNVTASSSAGGGPVSRCGQAFLQRLQAKPEAPAAPTHNLCSSAPETLLMISTRCFPIALPRFARPTMPDDLSRQIEACKSCIASVRSRIRAMQAAGETSSEAEQQLAREAAFLRTLEDIRSEKELNAEPKPGADDAGVRTKLLH